MWHNFALLFAVLSVCCFLISGFLIWQRYYNPNRLSFAFTPPPAESKLKFWPQRITIPELKIDLPVIPSTINNGVWSTTHLGVSYLATSTRPGEIGNSIFYGHNWPNLLGKLHDLSPGHTIIVTGQGETKTFWVAKTQIVTPSQISVLASGPFPQLTLYTCYGFADTKRFVVTAYTQAPK